MSKLKNGCMYAIISAFVITPGVLANWAVDAVGWEEGAATVGFAVACGAIWVATKVPLFNRRPYQ